jgi:hypothetical protein
MLASDHEITIRSARRDNGPIIQLSVPRASSTRDLPFLRLKRVQSRAPAKFAGRLQRTGKTEDVLIREEGRRHVCNRSPGGRSRPDMQRLCERLQLGFPP